MVPASEESQGMAVFRFTNCCVLRHLGLHGYISHALHLRAPFFGTTWFCCCVAPENYMASANWLIGVNLGGIT